MEKTCDNCGYRDSVWCMICEDMDCYKTEKEKKWIEMMCDMMCPIDEDEE